MDPEIDPDLNDSSGLYELRQRVAELEQSEADRIRRKKDAAHKQRRRDYQIILFLALSPLILEAFFFVLNRSYMSALFQDPNLPYGLAIQVAVLILALISFFTLRSSLSVLRSGRVLLGWAMGILAFLLFILPAWMFVFMAPAVLILLSSL
jgi:uncharacterized membrane-anchored protein